MAWSFILSAIGIVGLLMIGRNIKAGYAVGMAAQLVWVAYALFTAQFGFILAAAAYFAGYFAGFRNWAPRINQVRKPNGT